MNAPVIEIHKRFAGLKSTSLNQEKRTVEAVVATENPIPRSSYLPYAEKLKIDKRSVDLSRFTGAAVLDNHRQASVNDIVGVIETARIESSQIIATIRIERSAAGDAILAKIEDGVLRNVSIGYTVQEWSDATDEKGGRLRTATRWTLLEASFVAIPADPAAHIRSNDMPDDGITAAPQATPQNIPAAPVLSTRAHINTEIRSIATISGLDAEFANGLIDREASVEDARAAAFEEMQKRSNGSPIRTQTLPQSQTYDNPEFRSRAIGEAIFTRMNPAHKPSEPARAFIGLTLPEIGREICRRAGVNTTGMSSQTIITRALQTTSDFSLILGDTVNRTLRMAYDAAPSGVRQLARETTAKDFRSKHRLQLGEAPKLEKVGESGEFKYGGMTEAGETYALATFGKIIGISRQALINDDLGAFNDLSRRFGVSARSFENQTLVDLLESNPEMSDGEDLFSAAHGNLASSGAAPDEATLSAARLAMRKQTGLTSELISVTPKFILASSERETALEKLLTAIQATETDNANPFSKLSLLIEPRLSSATAWYVAADTAEVDGLEYSYLEGEPGPQIESRNGFEIDGVQIKIRLDFGAGFVDHRGWYKNAGA